MWQRPPHRNARSRAFLPDAPVARQQPPAGIAVTAGHDIGDRVEGEQGGGIQVALGYRFVANQSHEITGKAHGAIRAFYKSE